MHKVTYIKIQDVYIYRSGASKGKISYIISLSDKSARVIFYFNHIFLNKQLSKLNLFMLDKKYKNNILNCLLSKKKNYNMNFLKL